MDDDLSDPSSESNLSDSSDETFNISQRTDPNADGIQNQGDGEDARLDNEPKADADGGEIGDVRMSKREFLALRHTIIGEAAEEDEEDSFEIKKEIKKKKDFEAYSSKLESI